MKEREKRELDLEKFTAGKQLTDLEQSILEYVVEHIEEIQDMGVRDVAEETYTSPASVIRLSKKLGYTGFTDMYYSLLPIVKKAKQSLYETGHGIIDFNFSAILNEFSEDKVDSFNTHIFNKSDKYIFIYATGFSNIIAEYMNKKLLVLGRKAIISSGSDSIGIFENNLEDISSMLVVSKSGETSQVYNKLAKAVEAGIYTISFTQDSANRIAELSDLNIPIIDLHPMDDRNMLPNVFFPGVLLTFECLLEKYLEKF